MGCRCLLGVQNQNVRSSAGLPTFKVKDQVGERWVLTVMAVGPARRSKLRDVTATLKVLL